MTKAILLTGLFLSLFSCNKLRDYLREPDTEVIVETLNSTRLTGHAVTLAMAVMNGYSVSTLSLVRSNDGFPCSAVIGIDLSEYIDAPAERVTIAGIWANETTAVLSMIFSNYYYDSRILELVGIETIPVIIESDNIHIALASQEIDLNPDQDAFLAINLDDFQFESELIRLDQPLPGDVYIAITQKAYFINVIMAGTPGDITDDSYIISGGGQLIQVVDNSAEIVQQAVVEVLIAPSCRLNPVTGMALLRVTGVKEDGFPELGTALLEFTDNCQGKADVFLATGMYATSTGKKVSFLL